MIDTKRARRYCKDDLSQIENYGKAVNDITETWQLHHRDEIKVLPSGMKVYRSRQDLIENGRYYHCPANELIFLTHSEHQIMHHKGKPLSSEHRLKISESLKGENNPFYGKVNPMQGRHHSAEARKKQSEAQKAYWERRRQGGNA